MIKEVTKSLIQKNLKHHPIYGNGFSNHISMSLVALDLMGGSEEQLNNYYANSISELNPRKKLARDHEFKFTKEALGQPDLIEDFFYHFLNQLDTIPLDELLYTTVPILMEGVAGAAFHPLIRLSYALKANYTPEIALSLAYWASEFLALKNDLSTITKGLTDIRIKLDDIATTDSDAVNITERMKIVNNSIQKVNIPLQPKNINLDDIRRYCLEEFSKNNNFTMLHTVTVCHAFSTVFKYCKNDETSLCYLWEAILVAQLSTGIRYTPEPIKEPDTKIPWSTLIKQAARSTDDHVIKLVYTCWDENTKSKNPLYHYVAQRAVT